MPLEIHTRNPAMEILVKQLIATIDKQGDRVVSALNDLTTAESKMAAAVEDAVAFIKDAAAKIADGVSGADAETIAADLSAKADALETALGKPPTPPTPAA